MKKILFLIAALWAGQSSAQSYFSKGYQVPLIQQGYTHWMIPMADGSMVYGHNQDSVISITQLDATTGDVIRQKTIIGTPAGGSPDALVRSSLATYYPAQDSGLVITFRRFAAFQMDSTTVTVIKMDKQLNVEWGRQYIAQDSGAARLFVPGMATDAAGNVYFNYEHHSVKGLVKISTTGAQALDYEASVPNGGILYPVRSNQFLLLTANPDPTANSTALHNSVFDDQLQLVSERAYKATGTYYFRPLPVQPVYQQPLIAGIATNFLQVGNATSSNQNSYFVMDTAGRMLQLVNLDATVHVTNVPIEDVKISPDNKLSILGVTDTSGFVQVSDTAGNIVFAKSFKATDNRFTQAPFFVGTDLIWPSYRSMPNYLRTADIFRTKGDGTGSCAVLDSLPGFEFLPVALDTAQNANTINLSAGSLSSHLVTIDTLPSAPLTPEDLCNIVPPPTPTNVASLSAKTEHATVVLAGKNQMQLTLPSSFGNSLLELRDISGRLMYRGQMKNQKETLTVPDIASGIYIWNVYGQSGQHDAGKLFLQ